MGKSTQIYVRVLNYRNYLLLLIIGVVIMTRKEMTELRIFLRKFRITAQSKEHLLLKWKVLGSHTTEAS